jgi:hypothetical protein
VRYQTAESAFEEVTMAKATGTFQVENWEENPILEADDGAKVTRAEVQMSFEGDLEGKGVVEWLMGYAEDGTATYVGLERVVGKVGDKTGSFVVQHTGTFDGQTAKSRLEVVPGSGTGELSGLRGEGSFEAGMGSDGQRNVSLEYEV